VQELGIFSGRIRHLAGAAGRAVTPRRQSEEVKQPEVLVGENWILQRPTIDGNTAIASASITIISNTNRVVFCDRIALEYDSSAAC
jgi:hypothetical protein